MEALSAIQQGRERAITYAHSPWWYYPVLGASYALLGIAFALGGSVVRTLALIAFLAGGSLMQRGIKQINGVWVGGLRSGVATWWSIGFLLISLGTLVAGWLVSENIGSAWPVWVMAVTILMETLLYGVIFDRAIQQKRSQVLP